MTKPMTVQQFFAEFPDDNACLDHLFAVRYGNDPVCPKCGQVGKFHRLAKLPAFTCNCGHHVHPMVDTPFHRSRTPLQKWFFAMFLFTTTRNGVAAKEIQRQMGVTYKTAWRMANLIRKYIGWVDGDTPLGGTGGGIVERPTKSRSAVTPLAALITRHWSWALSSAAAKSSPALCRAVMRPRLLLA